MPHAQERGSNTKWVHVVCFQTLWGRIFEQTNTASNGFLPETQPVMNMVSCVSHHFSLAPSAPQNVVCHLSNSSSNARRKWLRVGCTCLPLLPGLEAQLGTAVRSEDSVVPVTGYLTFYFFYWWWLCLREWPWEFPVKERWRRQAITSLVLLMKLKTEREDSILYDCMSSCHHLQLSCFI